MATENILLLSIAYVIPLMLLGIFASDQCKKHVLLIATLLILLPVFYILHYQGILALSGWPTSQNLPEKFDLLGQQIKEPDKGGNQSGYIRLWVQAEDMPVSRLYELPYSQALHKKLASAQQRQAAGRQQQGHSISGNNNAVGEASSRGDEIDFSDKQTPRPPAKTNQASSGTVN